MRTLSEVSTQQKEQHSTNAGYRFSNTVALLGALSLVGAIATWRGAVLPVAIPLVLILVGTVLFVATRRALHRASARIDLILREERDRDLR